MDRHTRPKATEGLANYRGSNRERDIDDGGTNQPPSLQPTRDEIQIRHAAKSRIAAKYGLESWEDAPNDALREYWAFLRQRALGKDASLTTGEGEVAK